MPISIAHFALVMLLMLAVAIPGVVGLLFMLVGKLRSRGRRLLFGSVGSAAGICAYQIAYIPVMIAGLVATMPLLYCLDESWRSSVSALLFIVWLFLFWFAALCCGYYSGWRVGCKFGDGTPWKDSVRIDFLHRVLTRMRFRKKKVDPVATDNDGAAPRRV